MDGLKVEGKAWIGDDTVCLLSCFFFLLFSLLPPPPPPFHRHPSGPSFMTFHANGGEAYITERERERERERELASLPIGLRSAGVCGPDGGCVAV